MLGRLSVFILITISALILPWYITVAALAAAVVLYAYPFEFMVVGFFMDVLFASTVEPKHHLVVTIVLLSIYTLTIIVRDRLRFV